MTIDATHIKLNDSFCAAWRECIPNDFASCLGNGKGNLSEPEMDAIETASSPSEVASLITPDVKSRLSKTQAFIIVCWMTVNDGWTYAKNLSDDGIFHEVMDDVVKHAIGPRIARSMLQNGLESVMEMQKIAGPSFVAPDFS